MTRLRLHCATFTQKCETKKKVFSCRAVLIGHRFYSLVLNSGFWGQHSIFHKSSESFQPRSVAAGEDHCYDFSLRWQIILAVYYAFGGSEDDLHTCFCRRRVCTSNIKQYVFFSFGCHVAKYMPRTRIRICHQPRRAI
jgi:hypothetical protein